MFEASGWGWSELTLVDVGQNTTLCNGDVSQQLVQLLIVADGELKMTGDDTGLLVVTGGVASKLENFGSEILENGSEVDRSTGTDTLSIVALAKKTVNTADREGQTSLGRTAKMDMLVMEVKARERGQTRTTERSWSQRLCHQTCHRRSF